MAARAGGLQGAVPIARRWPEGEAGSPTPQSRQTSDSQGKIRWTTPEFACFFLDTLHSPAAAVVVRLRRHSSDATEQRFASRPQRGSALSSLFTEIRIIAASRSSRRATAGAAAAAAATTTAARRPDARGGRRPCYRNSLRSLAGHRPVATVKGRGRQSDISWFYFQKRGKQGGKLGCFAD